ncbi:hypothetical protein [Pseudomonas svalbardensis]|uniref:hypothetical protein n=1 Tax=Pseudomonas svalbardensis TaxID=3042029 RepID=UPI0024B3A68E|nr:hypothetical protein [Pseudomonas sp. PMCC200367]
MKGVTEKAKPFPVRVEHLNTDVFYGMDFKRIGPGLVISRDSTGSPICHFEDYEWSFPAYKLQLKDKCDFSFSYLKRDTSVDLTSTFFCKKIFLMRMFFPGSKSGQPIRLPSMHVMGLLLRKLFDFSEQHSVSVQAVFLESSNFETFADTLPVSLFKEVKLLIRTMNRLSISDLGFSVSGMVLLSIKKRFAEAFKEADQHPVIPSRILWTKYVQYNTCLADFDKHSHQLVEFIQKVSRNPYYARRYKPDGSSSDPDFSEKSTLDNQDSYTDFLPAIDDFGLQELQKKYKWRHVGNVSSFLSLVQYCCKSLIHIYTLMRHHEALELCTDCLESVRGWNNDALYVASISTKLTSTAAPNKWITIDAIVKPIEILTVINSLLSPFVKNEDNRDRLFISVSVLPFSNGVDPQDGKLVSGANCESKLSPVLITEDDIFELEAIDPFRNWRADKKFQIGKPWRITSHQFADQSLCLPARVDL